VARSSPDASPSLPTGIAEARPEASDPRGRAREARRQALLETAERVFAERGFAGATMAEIAARAGYSAGNLYNVFASKEALFHEVCRDASEQLHREQRAILREPAPFGERLLRTTEHLIDFCIAHRSFFAIYVRTTGGAGWNIESYGDEALRMERETEEEATRSLARAMEMGEVAAGDAAVCQAMVNGAFHQLIVRWIQNDGTAEDLRKQSRALLALLRRALGLGESS
jgi:AcrR family transcriptional regulator